MSKRRQRGDARDGSRHIHPHLLKAPSTRSLSRVHPRLAQRGAWNGRDSLVLASADTASNCLPERDITIRLDLCRGTGFGFATGVNSRRLPTMVVLKADPEVRFISARTSFGITTRPLPSMVIIAFSPV